MSDPLSVVHAVVSLRASYGGPARTVPSLCDALAARGVQTRLVTVDNATDDDGLLLPRDPAVAVVRVPGLTNASGLVRWAPAFRAAVLDAARHGERTVLHDHGLWRPTNRAMAAAARATGLPLVVSMRGMLEPWALGHKALRKRIALALYARRDLDGARLLHAASDREATSLRALGLRAPIAVIPNGVALPAGVAAPDPSRPQRQLVFIGRIAPIKGLLTLLLAWARARPAGWRLVIAGPDEGGHRAGVERAIAASGVGDSVALTGAVTEAGKWALLAESDALVLPSVSESFGMAIVEALAAARPAIASSAAPWRGLVDARCGWHVDPTADQLALAIAALTSLSDGDRAEMGARGRSLVASEFGWPSVAARMHAAYSWLVDGGTPSADVHVA